MLAGVGTQRWPVRGRSPLLSPADMLIIGAAALLFFGPDQLPKVARRAGQVVREVQSTSQSFIREMERAADESDFHAAQAAYAREPESGAFVGPESGAFVGSESGAAFRQPENTTLDEPESATSSEPQSVALSESQSPAFGAADPLDVPLPAQRGSTAPVPDMIKPPDPPV